MPEPYKTNSPKKLEELREKERKAIELREKDLRHLLTLPEFRRYIWRHMCETCGMMRSSASPNGSTQSINIGMQDVARAMFAEIETIDALSIPLMMTEHYEAQK